MKIKSFIIIYIFSVFNLSISDAKSSEKPDVPEWVNSAVFYQIYPQTFKDTDGDGIGDLTGIIEKLDYIKSLGVNALWLNPFYESPFCDAGYDVADFYEVAPRYGTNDIAKQLFVEAHERGIRVIIDFVVGHTSIDHPWFKASCVNDPKYNNWYIWTNDTWPTIQPTEYLDKFIKGFAPRNGMYMINFFWCQPKLNYGFERDDIKYDWQLPTDHPDVMALKDEMKNILKYWLDMGADGFRVDMAGSAGKDFWLDVRKMMDRNYPESFLISEWGVPADAIEAGFHADFMHWYRGYDDLFHKKWFTRNENTHSFFEASGKGNITVFLEEFFDQHGKLKGNGYISLPVDNHDMVRVKNFGRDDKDLEIIYAFQMTFPNIPFIYYGDEIGMRQLPLDEQLAVEGSYGTRSGNRSPMQWNDSKNYGFSSAATDALYLPQDRAENAPTVSKYEANAQSLIHKTRKLIKLRKNEKALLPYGDVHILYAEKNKYPFIYSRHFENEIILVVLNPSQNDVMAKIAFECDAEPELLSGQGITVIKQRGYTRVVCKGRSYSIFKY